MRTERADINQVLMQMRAMKSQAQAPSQAADIANPQASQATGLVDRVNQLQSDSVTQVNKAESPGFNNMLMDAVNKVNDIQKNAGEMQKAYVRGDSDVSISEVMIASQKSSVAFDAVTQVRNKLVKAYEDIMNMPM